MYEQGEILIVPFPFTDLTSIKQRPVLVLSKSEDNKKSQDLITCGITSNLGNSKYSVLIEDKDLISGTIPKTSRIKLDKLFTLSQDIVKKKIGKVNGKIIIQIREEFFKLV